MTKPKYDWANDLKKNEEKFEVKACLVHGFSRTQARTGAQALDKMYEYGWMPKEVYNDQDGFDAARAVLKMIEIGVLELPSKRISSAEASATGNSTPTSPEQVKGENIRLAARGLSKVHQDLTSGSGKAVVDPVIAAKDTNSHSPVQEAQADPGDRQGLLTNDSDKPLVIVESEAEVLNQEIPPTTAGSTTGRGAPGDQLMRDQLRELKLAQSG